ncbi:hypothetical protein ABGB12_03175 [Actinocorallia sp. B10E7]|uniref:hypothetical protein n=1 Tax=Actinocorallia sp. B10E7 TaxID=3153558 RepID=UPI00325E5ED4
MIAIIAITCISFLFLTFYLWLVLTFGLRTRRTVFRTDRETRPSRRQKRTLWVISHSPSPPARDPSPEKSPTETESSS